MTFHVPEAARITHGEMASDTSFGNSGAFLIALTRPSGPAQCFCIASDGLGWEHVSVSIRQGGKSRMPTWDDMCAVKSIFWDPEDCIVQFHPPASSYVSNHPNCLHLWRCTDHEFPQPPEITVGIHNLGDLSQTLGLRP